MNEKGEAKALVQLAQAYATKAHEGQLEDTGKPYIVHPEQVVAILERISDDPVLLAAGWLHDTLEDTHTTYAALLVQFGAEIADLVFEVTHEGSKEGGYYFPNLVSKRAYLLKFADRLSNLSRMENWPEARQAQYMHKSRFWPHSPAEMVQVSPAVQDVLEQANARADKLQALLDECRYTIHRTGNEQEPYRLDPIGGPRYGHPVFACVDPIDRLEHYKRTVSFNEGQHLKTEGRGAPRRGGTFATYDRPSDIMDAGLPR